MSRRALRSRSLVKVHKITPSGRKVLHFKKKKPSIARCACGRPLAGVPSDLPYRLSKIAKSSRRPSRPFGGALCAVCTRQVVKQKARMLSKI